MNDLDNTYMERIAELAKKKGNDQGFDITAIVKVSKIEFSINLIKILFAFCVVGWRFR